MRIFTQDLFTPSFQFVKALQAWNDAYIPAHLFIMFSS